MTIGQIKIDPTSNKFVLPHPITGEILMTSPKRGYIPQYFRENSKAIAAGITSVVHTEETYSPRGITVSIGDTPESIEEIIEDFHIDQRFDILESYIQAISTAQQPTGIKSVLVTGRGGIGKSHTVLTTLKARGLVNADDLENIGDDYDFLVMKGRTADYALYKTIYENKSKVIIFDDCDSVWKSDSALSILKAALESNGRRIIHWNSSMCDADGIPRSFEFVGSVIFISNMPKRAFDEAVLTRTVTVDLHMTMPQILARMQSILPNLMTHVPFEHRVEAFEFLKLHSGRAGSLSLRALMQIITFRTVAEEIETTVTWQDMALNNLLR